MYLSSILTLSRTHLTQQSQRTSVVFVVFCYIHPKHTRPVILVFHAIRRVEMSLLFLLLLLSRGCCNVIVVTWLLLLLR